MKKYTIYWKIMTILILVIVVPIIVNFFMITPSPYDLAVGDVSAWIGFFGNYSGGLLGGIVAYIIANNQNKLQKENEKEARFVQQLPTLVKLNLQLEEIETFLGKLEKMLRFKQTFDIVLTNFQNPIEIKEEYWDDLDKINDPSIIVEIIKLKESYLNLSNTIKIDLNDVFQNITDLDKKVEDLNKISPKNQNQEKKYVSYSYQLNKLKVRYKAIVLNKKQEWNKIEDRSIIRNVNSLKTKIEDLINQIEKINKFKSFK